MFSDEEMKELNDLDYLIDNLIDYIDTLGTSRELSLAKTKVEEAQLWMLKHLSRED